MAPPPRPTDPALAGWSWRCSSDHSSEVLLAQIGLADLAQRGTWKGIDNHQSFRRLLLGEAGPGEMRTQIFEAEHFARPEHDDSGNDVPVSGMRRGHGRALRNRRMAVEDVF